MKLLPTVLSALGKVTKRLVEGREDLEIRGGVETLQTTTLLKSARILKTAQEIEETCYHSDSCGKPSANAGVQNSQMTKIIPANKASL